MVSSSNMQLETDSSMLQQMDMDITDADAGHFSSDISHEPLTYDTFASMDSTLPEQPPR